MATRAKKSSKGRVPLVLTYSRMLPDVRGILQKHQNVLHRSDRMKSVFAQPPLLAYRRDRNICDTLVHSKTKREVYVPTDCTCKICIRIERERVYDTSKVRSFTPVPSAKCSTRNVVYCLLCIKCDKTVYVGETERSVKERFTEHLRDVRLHADKPINRHFHDHEESDVKISVLKALYDNTKEYRLLHEEQWIKRLDTKNPHGCNIKYNVMQGW